jgi:hypothetical protein
MMYNQSDIVARMKAVLPNRWFGDDTPLLDALLNALSTGWMSVLTLLTYATAQTRIATATDSWLDLIALDFFNNRLNRRPLETDGSFRSRIGKELLRDRCTRAAINDALLDITGRAPAIFEPANPGDTGCYGSLSSSDCAAGYGVSGGWGSLDLPFQVFVTAFRSEETGVAMVNGWSGYLAGFGVGVGSYIGAGANPSQATDLELYQTVSRVAPAGAIVWMVIKP